MTPQREPHATLVDLLDRVLDKGPDHSCGSHCIDFGHTAHRRQSEGRTGRYGNDVEIRPHERVGMKKFEGRGKQKTGITGKKHRLAGNEKVLILEMLGACHDQRRPLYQMAVWTYCGDKRPPADTLS